MSSTVIFAGTTEGRELAESFAAAGEYCDVCVATEYGSEAMEPSEYINVHQGRLDAEGMRKLYSETGCSIVVDATHPHASIATRTIQESIKGTGYRYIRLIRPSSYTGNWEEYPDAEACAKALEKTEGKVFLATGSKDLKIYCRSETLRNRLVVRVLPGLESITLCHEAGLNGRQIVAMQGPFTKEMNTATFSQFNIKHLVTKESGTTGGFDTKILAAQAVGAKIHVIDRPQNDNDFGITEGLTISQTKELLNSILGISLPEAKLDICLAGIGCGSSETLTVGLKKRIECSDYIFGAPRMLEGLNGNARKYPYYLSRDILPEIQSIARQRSGTVNITILFSGDSGFFSGAKKMREALINVPGSEISVLPGISSLSYLSSKIGLPWHDSDIVSLHGTKLSEVLPKLRDSIKYKGKTFFLTSGPEDIRQLSELLQDFSDLDVYIGKNLSYPDEEILNLTIAQCSNVIEPGLYCGMIINRTPEKKYLVPVLKDSDFFRDKIPMTKEDIRHLSICRLNLRAGDIIYDIGSGTGSIAIQTASMSPDIRVYALECNPEAISLISRNMEKFNVHNNIEVIHTLAPAGLAALPTADCAFIGGSKGNLNIILDTLYTINSHMRIVINAVSMESICEIYEAIKKYPTENEDICQVNVSRAKKLGEYNMLQANNPVFIFSFTFRSEKGEVI